MFIERMRVSNEFALDAESGTHEVGEDGIYVARFPGKVNLMITIDFYDVEPEQTHLFNVMHFDHEDRLHGGWTDQTLSVSEGENSATAVIVQEGLEISEPGRRRFVVIEGKLEQGYSEYHPLYTKDVLVATPEQIHSHGHSH